MRLSRAIVGIVITFLVLLTPRSAYAVAYDLIPPSGPLERGQNIQFIIDIDTQGSSITTATVGMEYDTQYLQYISAQQGDAMDSLTATVDGTNRLLLTGTNTAGFNGIGTFAYVTFKLIATAPGSTELCVLYAPSTTPTPTTPAGVTPTKPPNPTQLPQSGQAVNGYKASAIAGAFLAGAAGLIIWSNRSKYVNKPANRKKHA